jgi:hypothetical protein
MARVKLQITLLEEIKESITEEAQKQGLTISLWIELVLKQKLEIMKRSAPKIDLGF